jgi:hypothetical protein
MEPSFSLLPSNIGTTLLKLPAAAATVGCTNSSTPSTVGAKVADADSCAFKISAAGSCNKQPSSRVPLPASLAQAVWATKESKPAAAVSNETATHAAMAPLSMPANIPIAWSCIRGCEEYVQVAERRTVQSLPVQCSNAHAPAARNKPLLR